MLDIKNNASTNATTQNTQQQTTTQKHKPDNIDTKMMSEIDELEDMPF
jgi:hypothetical protein